MRIFNLSVFVKIRLSGGKSLEGNIWFNDTGGYAGLDST